MKRAIIAAFGDQHGGHTLGLLNPSTKLKDWDIEGNPYWWTPKLNKSQEHLWYDCYEKDIADVSKLAGKDPIVAFNLGDITQGQKYISQWVSTRSSDQIFIAEANMLPWFALKNLHVVRLVRGTDSHGFGEGSADLTVEGLLQRRFPKRNIDVVFHGLADILGIKVDYAHHGPYTGSRNWLKGNVARYYLRSAMMDEIQIGNVPPHLYIRGHYHNYAEEYLRISNAQHAHKSWLTVLPSYCLMSDYARQATRSQFSVTNGMVAYEVVDDRIVEIHPFTHTIDIRTKEKIL